MTVKLFAFTCGWLTGELGYLMAGGEGVFGHDGEFWKSVPQAPAEIG
jgi:hypothetical protein